MMNDHNYYLLKALTLAWKGKGCCAPNPAVGAVIVKDNQIIAEGYHQGPGTLHAEAVALQPLNEQARGATLYVTLEPCCHWGKTPPCTDAIIKSGIAHVVYGYQDPNPKVSGQGVAQLQAQGIACTFLQLPDIQAFYQSYYFWMTTKRPWVTAKLAMSLDGKIALKGCVPTQITGKEANQKTHQGRLQSDVILTTARTILCDNPQLNVRLDTEIIAKPIAILDRDLTLMSSITSLNIYNTAKSLMIFFSNHAAKLATKLNHIEEICLTVNQDQHFDLAEVLAILGSRGYHEVWVEAGGILFSSLLKERLINKAIIYVAPKCLGSHAYSAFLEKNRLFDDYQSFQWSQIGNDLCCEIVFLTNSR